MKPPAQGLADVWGAAAGILAQSASQVLMFTGREDPMPRLLAERGVCPF